MIRIHPQPEFAQVHHWDGRLIYDGSHRQWCWRDEVISDRWDGIDGCARALSERSGVLGLQAILLDETWWWTDDDDKPG